MKIKFLFLLFIASSFIQLKAQETASSLIDDALEQARAENKNVFVKYSASWCGWCKKMDKQMKSDACKAFFDDNYVMVNLVVLESDAKKDLETPGAEALYNEQSGGKAGLPFWVILDKDGTVLEDAFNAKGQNLGCPYTEEEVESFLTILKNTSNLTADDLAVIGETFQENKK